MGLGRGSYLRHPTKGDAVVVGQLNDELCLALLQHEPALNSYLQLLHRSAALEEQELLSGE